jgi:hypothetical protein
MKESLKPWQVMPARIIKMALEHGNKGTDFDHQISFLLLDIGVEITLKTYLINKNQNVDHLNFKELIIKSREESAKDKKEIPLDDVNYFHTLRNKLYHQGDGVKPTGENLERYSSLTQKLIKVLLDINIEDINKFELKNRSINDFKELGNWLSEKLKYFHDSCAIVTEQVRPDCTTRLFAMKWEFIQHEYGKEEDLNDYFDDEDIVELSEAEKGRIIIERQNERVTRFNELLGAKFNIRFLDFLAQDINHLYTYLALREAEISEDFVSDINKYREIVDSANSLLEKVEGGGGSLPDSTKVNEEYNEIVSWLRSKRKKVDEWINTHLSDIYREVPISVQLEDFIDPHGEKTQQSDRINQNSSNQK